MPPETRSLRAGATGPRTQFFNFSGPRRNDLRFPCQTQHNLPEFKLAVQSKDPNDRATLRDVLSHRTGFTRMSLLEANRGLSSDEIPRRISSAEAYAPFRQRFLYNNEHYLAARSAAAVVAGTSWDALMKERLLTPLGMTATRTSLREAWNDPRTAWGCWRDEAGKRIRTVTIETLGNNIGIAPAGAISSTALDMTSWLRFLLRQVSRTASRSSVLLPWPSSATKPGIFWDTPMWIKVPSMKPRRIESLMPPKLCPRSRLQLRRARTELAPNEVHQADRQSSRRAVE
jgi:CubicO group peptidase (beta-lactamase class C family)